MNKHAVRILGVTLLLASCLGCNGTGSVFRDTINVMAIPAVWLGSSDATQSDPLNKNSPNSDQWTASKWGRRD